MITITSGAFFEKVKEGHVRIILTSLKTGPICHELPISELSFETLKQISKMTPGHEIAKVEIIVHLEDILFEFTCDTSATINVIGALKCAVLNTSIKAREERLENIHYALSRTLAGAFS